MRTRSVRPSPDMSARKIDSVPSAKTSSGLSPRPGPGHPQRGAEALRGKRLCHQKASSSVISRSAKPSPVRSTNFRFGSCQSRTGSDAKGVKGSQPRPRCARRSRAWGPNSTRSSWPSPARSRNCCWPLAGRQRGLAATSSSRAELRKRELRAIVALLVDRAQVRLVEPAAGLLGQDAGEPLAVEVDPAVLGAIEAIGQVLQALADRCRARSRRSPLRCSRTRAAAATSRDSPVGCACSRSGWPRAGRNRRAWWDRTVALGLRWVKSVERTRHSALCVPGRPGNDGTSARGGTGGRCGPRTWPGK